MSIQNLTQVFAYIDAPTAEDSSTVEKGQEVLDPNVEYFIQIAEDGRTVSIVTVVDITWLLDESTLFPVLIDPSLGANTETSLTAGVANGASGGYKTCDVATVDCFTRTDAYLNQDYGYQSSAPFFDFQFTQPTSLSVGSVTAHVSYNNLGWTHNYAYEFTPIQIMEDCGGSPPDGDVYNLNYFANQDGCRQALPQHVPATLEPVVLTPQLHMNSVTVTTVWILQLLRINNGLHLTQTSMATALVLIGYKALVLRSKAGFSKEEETTTLR